MTWTSWLTEAVLLAGCEVKHHPAPIEGMTNPRLSHGMYSTGRGQLCLYSDNCVTFEGPATLDGRGLKQINEGREVLVYVGIGTVWYCEEPRWEVPVREAYPEVTEVETSDDTGLLAMGVLNLGVPRELALLTP